MQYTYYLDLSAIGSHIKIAREKAGLKQRQLAEKIGIEENYLSEIERGLACPSFPLMVAFSDILNVSMQFLTKGTDDAGQMMEKVERDAGRERRGLLEETSDFVHKENKWDGDGFVEYKEIAITKEDAKKYLYSIDNRRRIIKWDDIKIRIFI